VNEILLSTLFFRQEGEHAAGPLGIPLVIWQLANLIGFLAVLLYFVARPMTNLFRQRQLEVERRLKEAQERRAEAARLEAQIHQRMAELDRELAEIRARGIAEGEAARAELIGRAEQEAEAVRRHAEEEIARRLETALERLRAVAAELTANTAREILAGQMTEEDRRRLFAESVAELERRA
jgi:F-type H+-transporting ATPase subunit b